MRDTEPKPKPKQDQPKVKVEIQVEAQDQPKQAEEQPKVDVQVEYKAGEAEFQQLYRMDVNLLQVASFDKTNWMTVRAGFYEILCIADDTVDFKT